LQDSLPTTSSNGPAADARNILGGLGKTIPRSRRQSWLYGCAAGSFGLDLRENGKSMGNLTVYGEFTTPQLDLSNGRGRAGYASATW
jgi:hypothetical protein